MNKVCVIKRGELLDKADIAVQRQNEFRLERDTKCRVTASMASLPTEVRVLIVVLKLGNSSGAKGGRKINT